MSSLLGKQINQYWSYSSLFNIKTQLLPGYRYYFEDGIEVREKVSQFDKDNFTYACRQEFENFAEFVALHYSLSHRDDTEYWKANFNKTWSNDVIERKPSLTVGINSAIKYRAFDFTHSPNNDLHYIAAGNNWAPTDKLSLLQRSNLDDVDSFLKIASMLMVSKKQKWINEAEKFPSLYQYLKENYYNA